MTRATGYRADAADALIVRPLDEIVLIYHRPSGQTHMVMSPVPEILAVLDMTPGCHALDVRDRLALDYDLGEPDAALAEITAHLEEMVRLGLASHA